MLPAVTNIPRPMSRIPVFPRVPVNPVQPVTLLPGQLLEVTTSGCGCCAGRPLSGGGTPGVAFASLAQARGCVVTTVLMFVVGIAIIAGVVWLMMRMERATVNGKTVSMVHRF